MTKVLLERDGYKYTLRCKDHADSDASCAAVSMMCYALAGYLHNIKCHIDTEKLEPGDVEIIYRSTSIEAEAAFNMSCVSFLQLEQSYPGAADVEITEIS